MKGFLHKRFSTGWLPHLGSYTAFLLTALILLHVTHQPAKWSGAAHSEVNAVAVALDQYYKPQFLWKKYDDFLPKKLSINYADKISLTGTMRKHCRDWVGSWAGSRRERAAVRARAASGPREQGGAWHPGPAAVSTGDLWRWRWGRNMPLKDTTELKTQWETARRMGQNLEQEDKKVAIFCTRNTAFASVGPG